MRTYTKEQIERMGPGEKDLALEIDAFEAREELEAQKELDTPSHEAVEPEVTPVIQQETPSEEPKQTEEKDVDYWKKLAEEKAKESDNWKKRQGDALKTLTPVQQEAAELRKTNSALEAKLESLASKMDALLSKPSVTASDDSESDDFRETYPEISKQIARARQEAAREARESMEERLRQSEEKMKEFSSVKEAVERSRQEAAILQHFNEVKSIHSDAELFFNQVLGPAFTEWASTQSPMVEKIASQPLSASSKDVAWVISQFKADTGLNKRASKPSLGDSVTKVMSAPSSIHTEAKDNQLLTDYEFKHIDELLAKNGSNPKEQDRLLAAFENTILQQSKRR